MHYGKMTALNVAKLSYDHLRKNLDLSVCHTICRLCLSTDGQMEDLFFNPENEQLVEEIFECTSVKMEPANGIISAICPRCKLKLVEIYNFREQCVQCEDIFQNKVEEMEKETIEVVPDIFNMQSDEESEDAYASFVSVKEEIEIEDWKGLDIEDAMEVNGGAFLIKTSGSQPESESDSLLESLDDSVDIKQKFYTRTPPMDIDLKSLIVYVKGKKHWKCPHCEKYFSQSGNLKAHINTHTGYKPYLCNLCNRSFAQKSNLNYHMKASHDPQRPFKCNVCDKAFASMDQMVMHLKSKHEKSEPSSRVAAPKRHHCPYCGKAFTQSFNLKLHVNTHTGERPYKCDICPKTFTQRSNLNVHVNKSHKAQQQT